MVNTNYTSTEEMIDKLQEIKGKAKLNFYKNISNYYDIMNIRINEDPFRKTAKGINKIYHEVLLLMKFLQTKPQVKSMNIIYYDLCYTVIKKRDEREIVDNLYENDFNKFSDIIMPNHKPGETIIRY